MRDKSRDNWFSRLLDLPVGVVAGALYPLRAIAILARNSKLWGYIAFPIFLNVIIGVGLYIGLLRPGLGEIQGITVALDARITAWVANLPQWLAWLSWFGDLLGGLLQGILVVVLFLATGLLLVQFGAILGSPWYGQLSEELEKLKTGKVTTYEQGFWVIFKDIWRALAFEVKKIILGCGVGDRFVSGPLDSRFRDVGGGDRWVGDRRFDCLSGFSGCSPRTPPLTLSRQA